MCRYVTISRKRGDFRLGTADVGVIDAYPLLAEA
jgi:hypothetical protein